MKKLIFISASLLLCIGAGAQQNKPIAQQSVAPAPALVASPTTTISVLPGSQGMPQMNSIEIDARGTTTVSPAGGGLKPERVTQPTHSDFINHGKPVPPKPDNVKEKAKQ